MVACWAIAFALPLAACGRPDDPFQVQMALTSGSQDPRTAWVHGADVLPRATAAAHAAARLWGGDEDSLVGFTLHVIDADTIACMNTDAIGCTTFDSGRIEIATHGYPCIEITAVAHEVGHVVLNGDGGHTDPRWRDRDFGQAFSEALLALVPPSDVACADLLTSAIEQRVPVICY